MEQISSELPWKQIENQNAVLCALGSWEVAGLVALGLYRFKMYKLYNDHEVKGKPASEAVVFGQLRSNRLDFTSSKL
jgi:hypothetical protein